jgi:hypothetical protein
MKGKVVVGYVHSILNKYGDEMLLMGSFGATKTKSKKNFNFQNQQRLQPVKSLNRYLVHVTVMEKET